MRGGQIEGISDLRDESDREGMRIVVVLKRDAFPQVVLNKLYAHTQMQSTFGVINLALVGSKPVVMSLKETMQHFLDFREEVIVRRTRYDLRKAEERAHILEGYRIALDHIDEIVALIRGSESPEAARGGLMARFGLSEVQAQAILDMRLARLTGLERQKIEDEYRDLIEKISWYNQVLGSRALVLQIIREELAEVRAEVRRRAAHAHRRRRRRDRHRGPHRRRAHGRHPQQPGLCQAHLAGHLPAAGPRRQGHHGDADEGRGLRRHALRRHRAPGSADHHREGRAALAQGASDPPGRAHEPRQGRW